MAEIVYRSATRSGVVAFKTLVTITRPANTTAYAVSDLINANGAAGLISIEFGSEYANNVIEVNNVEIISSYGDAATKLEAGVFLFNNVSVLGAADAVQKDDNAAFAPTDAQVLAKHEASFEDVSTSAQIGTGAYSIIASEKAVDAKLDSTGKIYAAIIANNAYTPASGETLTLILKGYIL